MTHQCLNCGKTIPKGSDEILKGCQQCGGKKFIFVNAPLPQEKRMDLLKQAESVRADLVRKADPELLRVLKERGVTEIDGSTLQLESSPSGDWLRVRPGPERPSVRPSVKGMGREERDTGPQTFEQGPKRPSAKDIIIEFDKEHMTGLEPAATGPEVMVKDRVKPKTRKRPSKPKKRVLRAARKKGEGGQVRRGPPPIGTVNVIEQGVYEIDVERLLRDDPVIIENDGTYLIHLPSLLKARGEGRSRKVK